MYSYQNNHWLTCYLFSFTAAVFFPPAKECSTGNPFWTSVCDRKTPLCLSSVGVMSEMTHSRPPLTRLNYSGIAWYCPRVVAILKAPGGIISPLWIFKGHGSFHSSSLTTEKRIWADGLLRILFSYLWASMAHFQRCPWKCVERQAPQHGKTYNTLLLMPLVPLNMQTGDNGIHRTVGTDFLARLWNAYTASHCALCLRLLGKQWESQRWQRKHG